MRGRRPRLPEGWGRPARRGGCRPQICMLTGRASFRGGRGRPTAHGKEPNEIVGPIKNEGTNPILHTPDDGI